MPIGVGEVLRRIIGKCVIRVTKPDVIDACGSLEVCAGLQCGSEAAIHAMRNIFDADETDAVLLVDASNAFNALNRAAALHNVCYKYLPFTSKTLHIGREITNFRRGNHARRPARDELVCYQCTTAHLYFTELE